MKEPVFSLGQAEYIELDKLLKILRWVESGGQAHALIEQGLVLRNGQVETRKRAKLRPEDRIGMGGRTVRITKEEDTQTDTLPKI